jgi:hypothetical protein
MSTARSDFTWWNAINLDGSALVDPTDADRQTLTAQEILRRISNQPGVILADEVGLGKTFVALAVAASVAVSTAKRRPIVVMVPPALTEKWPQEWKTFEQYCLPRNSGLRATNETILRPAAFLRLFDDEADRRQHIAFVAHGALTRQLKDPFTRLALVRAGYRQSRKLKPSRERFPEWAAKLIDPVLTPDFTRDLLSAPLDRWREIVERYRPDKAPDDDPVYLELPTMIEKSGASLKALREVLADLPERRSANIDIRLRNKRKLLSAAVQELWSSILTYAPIRSPLLVLDEAHHVRHDGKIAGLFSSPAAEADAESLKDHGALAAKFDHMLFLTATPFQLGHRELIRVLTRFEGVRWSSAEERKTYENTIHQLSGSLDAFQVSAHRLQKLWTRLAIQDVERLPQDWWRASTEITDDISTSSRVLAVRSALSDLEVKCERAESQLRPWVIRHIRSDRSSRRSIFSGDAIRIDGDGEQGLAIDSTAVLPFLLAARARTIALDRRLTGTQARAYFAEGLASSFEAYRDTRRNREGFLDGVKPQASSVDDPELRWYLDWVERTMPDHDPESLTIHPKLHATVERTLDVWRRGEKVLVFCFYIETGRALRREISAALTRDLYRDAAEILNMDPGDTNALRKRLDNTADNVLSTYSAPRRILEKELTAMSRTRGLDPEEGSAFVGAVLRFLRTDSFLIRYLFPIGTGTAALLPALDKSDETGRTFRSRLEAFLDRLALLSDAQRVSALEALNHIQTGKYATLDDDEEDERIRTMILPNVRLANGRVTRKTRNILVTAFNMPFFPEVLISSPVLSEGVDLHWECRTVIHHDLDWNPSSLEQRTGRLDRIGSLSESMHMPIEIFEPYTTGLQDEKMYKVVSDRARWFNIVMGDDVQLTDQQKEVIAERVPLPIELTDLLTLDLSVVR